MLGLAGRGKSGGKRSGVTLLIIAFAMVLMSTVSAQAVEVTIVPHLEVSVNGTPISSPTKLDVAIPSIITIQWRDVDGQNVSGSVQGVLDGASFLIMRLNLTKPLTKEVRICSITVTQFAVQVTIAGLPPLDEVMVKVNGEDGASTYDPTTKTLSMSRSNVALPAYVEVYGKLAMRPFINFSAEVRDDGSLTIRELFTAVSQPLSIKAVVSRATGVIPIVVSPIKVETREVDTKTAGYEVVGRPLGFESVIVRITILGPERQPMAANVTIRSDEGESRVFVNGSAMLILPKDKVVLLKAEAKGYRPSERTLRTSANMDIEIMMERLSLWDQLMAILSNAVKWAGQAQNAVMLAIGLLALAALIIAVVRRR